MKHTKIQKTQTDDWLLLHYINKEEFQKQNDINRAV